MVGGYIKHMGYVILGIILILSVMQIMPFGRIVENASAGSSWVQTTDTDFSGGNLENLIINGSGTNAEVRLIKDGLEREYTVDANTVALWHFNEGSGSTAYDETSNNNDGTITGAAQAVGKFGNGLQFDGVDDYIVVPDSTNLNITDEITIEAWVKGSGADFSTAKRTTSAYNKLQSQLQVVGSKTHYVWREIDGSDYQIWTAEMNTDGTGFSATKRTFSAYNKSSPQLQVMGSKIYYVWHEDDGSYNQIWTAEMNTDGIGFSATKRTTSAYWKYDPQLQVVGSKIYYAWGEWDGSYGHFCTAEMNTDGTGWSATKRTTSAYGIYSPELQVVGTKIYYLWRESDESYYQIWTAEMNIDGTGWSATQRTTSAYNKYDPQLQVVGSKIYYVWYEYDGSIRQIWTAEMNTDGTGWSATQRTTSPYNKGPPQLQVVGSRIYYVWYEDDGSHPQIWTAEMNTDGTGFSATKRTTSAYTKASPQLQVVGSKIYYVWREDDGSYGQIWTAEMNSNIVNKGDFYGLGISDSTIKGFINAGVDGFKYNAEAIDYTAGAAVESTIDSNWNHITMTYDKSSLRLYVNGTLVDESAFTEAINTNPFDLIIGDDFNGIIDEVRISNIARAPGFSPTGALTSSILDTGSNSNFTTISWNPTNQPLNTDLKFQIATNNDASTWNFVGPDGTSSTYYTTASGESICSDHNGDRYLKYKAYLSTTNGSVTPTLQDVTINYNCIPDAPSLSGPSNNVWTSDNTPIFSWTFNDLDGTQSGFQVLIDDDIDFGSVYYDSGQQSSLNTYWQIPTEIPDGTWYWKARDRDNDGDWGSYSDQWAVKIDTTLPTVKSITLSDPSPTKTGTVTFTITFSEDMSTTVSPVVTFGKISPYDTHTTTQSSYSGDTWTGTFAIGTTTGDGTYTISVLGAEDLAGNQMVLDASYTFIIDTTHPTVTDKTPTGTGASLTTTISITFNEAMNKISVENAFGYTDGTTIWTAADGSISWHANTMIFTPGSDSSYETEYSVTIGTEAEDLAGNGLASPCTWSFTTLQESDTEPEEEFPLMWLITIPLAIIGILVFLYIGKGKDKSHELKPKTFETIVKFPFFSAKKKYHYKEVKKDKPPEESSEEEKDGPAPREPDEES